MSKAPTIGLLGLVLGSPSSPEEVEPFLTELFTDRDMMRLPFQRWLGPVIARKRTPKATARYQQIGGASPLMAISRQQVDGAAAALSARGVPARGYLAARYLGPRCAEVLGQMRDDGITRAVVLPLYPQASQVTTTSALKDLEQAWEQVSDGPALEVVRAWPDHAGYVAALAATVAEALAQLPEAARPGTHLLFAAHSIPQKLADRGDPYPDHVRQTTEAVLRELGWTGAHSNAYQSRVGPLKWLGPDTDEEVTRLAAEGVRGVVVVPVSFVSDHLETLYDLDLELAQTAREVGIEHLVRCAALNDRDDFLAALADLAADALEGAP